jgi:hypothetical protein
MKDSKELGKEVNYHGKWEEFHQKRKEWDLFEFHKAIRLTLLKEYRERKEKK